MNRNKLILILLLPIFLLISFFLIRKYFYKYFDNNKVVEKSYIPGLKLNSLDKYAIDNLINTEIQPAIVEVDKTIKKESNFTSYYGKISFYPEINTKIIKTTSCLINIPFNIKYEDKNAPIIILIRGYVDQKSYITGAGTKNVGGYFAKNGYITIAPDFLGYGSSDNEAGNIFESRFQTYVTVLSLLKAFENRSNIFIWGHSNGGQIALTVLEITGKNIPSVLWAPVSKPFPYSILYYTDDSEDGGKLIRSELSKFEDLYDTDKYSLTKYIDNIKAPLQIHQGDKDDAVPVAWSNELSIKLKSLNITNQYYIYPDADHNLRPGWDLAVQRSSDFYKSYIK